MSPKVSIIVPTYNTDPQRLDRLVSSIEAQTLPASDYEVVFVDDGSSSGIYAELERLAEQHENFSATRIENSGWACRPRNVGTRLARGDYVLFMDHDDVLFPEGLERSYAYGAQHDADVVNHKEIRTEGWAWSWGRFLEDDPEAHRKGIGSLIPMTPHKLYRRSFLLEHGIEFDEGARVLWEDVYFNTRVWAHGPRVAVLANHPVYHWVNTGENTSSTFGRDEHERWGQLHRLLHFFQETLPEGRDQDYLVEHWYKSRVLAVVGGNLDKKTDERLANELQHAREAADTLVPERIKKALSPFDRARQTIIDREDVEAARAFARAQAGIDARSRLVGLSWSGSSLRVSATTCLAGADGEPLGLERRKDGVVREIDRPFAELFGPKGPAIKNPVRRSSYLLSLKARSTREIWCLPGRGTVDLEPDGDGLLHLEAEIAGGVDLLSAAFGSPLSTQVWEIGGRLTALGKTAHRGVLVDEDLPMHGALVDGRTAVAFRNKSGMLSLDLGSHVKSVVAAAELGDADASVSRQDGRTELVIRLRGVHTHGVTRIPGRVQLAPGTHDGQAWQAEEAPAVRFDAELVGDEDGARVVARREGDLPPGQYRVRTEFEGRKHQTDLVLAT